MQREARHPTSYQIRQQSKCKWQLRRTWYHLLLDLLLRFESHVAHALVGGSSEHAAKAFLGALIRLFGLRVHSQYIQRRNRRGTKVAKDVGESAGRSLRDRRGSSLKLTIPYGLAH